jgi:hypothetical protein
MLFNIKDISGNTLRIGNIVAFIRHGSLSKFFFGVIQHITSNQYCDIKYAIDDIDYNVESRDIMLISLVQVPEYFRKYIEEIQEKILEEYIASEIRES